jgi:hypothetical protein
MKREVRVLGKYFKQRIGFMVPNICIDAKLYRTLISPWK